jgi:hypothetical protein
VADLGQAELLQQRRQVHAEPAALALAEAVTRLSAARQGMGLSWGFLAGNPRGAGPAEILTTT